MEQCKHPPTNLFSGIVPNPYTGKRNLIWVGCTICGEVLMDQCEDLLKTNGAV